MNISELKKAAQALVTAMETCHICYGTLLVEEGPMYCKDCSSDCDDHYPNQCVGIDVLHQRLKGILNS